MANEPDEIKQELQSEQRSLKRTERKSRRQEFVRARELKALQRAQKETGRVAKITGGEVAGRTAQLGTAAVVGMPTRIIGAAGSPFTFGATGALGQATAMTAEQAAYQAGKRTARPIAEQLGKAPYRPFIAMQKRRVATARRRKEEARAARKEIEKELAAMEGKDLVSLALAIPKWLLGKTAGAIVGIPLEITLSLVMMILVPILMIAALLFWYIPTIVVPFYLGS